MPRSLTKYWTVLGCSVEVCLASSRWLSSRIAVVSSCERRRQDEECGEKPKSVRRFLAGQIGFSVRGRKRHADETLLALPDFGEFF